MSQEQPKREDHQEEAITYGDVFNVQGDLKTKPIASVDAATMQKVESHLLGKNPKGGVAAAMQSAAMKNERDGVVGLNDINNIAAGDGVSVKETDSPGRQVISESVGEQVLLICVYMYTYILYTHAKKLLIILVCLFMFLGSVFSL